MKMVRLTEKYRPKTWEDVVGQEEIINSIRKVVERKGWDLPHLLFIGPPGNGKTTVARIIAKELAIDIHEFNASDERGIDFIRDEIKKLSQYMGERIIFLDEADQLTPPAQHAMRRIMEQTKGSIFILTGNREWQIIDAIKSRCAIYRFKPIREEEIQKKIVQIIQSEGLKVAASTAEEQDIVRQGIIRLVKKAKGDLRTALNDLEKIIDEHGIITPESVAVIESAVGLGILAMRQALAGKFWEGKDTIEKAFVEGKYNPRTIFSEIYEGIPELAGVDNEVKIRIFEKLGETEANSKRGSDPVIQLISFLAFIWLIPYLSKCPVLRGET